MFRNQLRTELYISISKGMLLIDPLSNQTYDSSNSSNYLIIIFPIMIILVTGLIGFIVKKNVKEQESISSKILYQTVVYNLFMNAVIIFTFVAFFNSIQFYNLTNRNMIDPRSSLGMTGNIFSYFGLAVSFFMLYLCIYILNPKFGQTETSWKKYIKSNSFNNFRKLHEGFQLNPWYKRNKLTFSIIKKMILAILFYWGNGFELMVIVFEFIDIFYIFTIRPFKKQVYINLAVICKLMMFIFYGFVVLGNLYFSLGSITITYISVKKYLYARDIIFLLSNLIIFLLIIFELYEKCSNLNYQIRLVREENQFFKFKITEKEKIQEDSIKRNHTKSMADSD